MRQEIKTILKNKSPRLPKSPPCELRRRSVRSAVSFMMLLKTFIRRDVTSPIPPPSEFPYGVCAIFPRTANLTAQQNKARSLSAEPEMLAPEQSDSNREETALTITLISFRRDPTAKVQPECERIFLKKEDSARSTVHRKAIIKHPAIVLR